MRLKAIVHEAEEGGYWAEVPALPGCATQAENLKELEENLKEAIELWLETSNELEFANSAEQILEIAV